MTNFEPHELTKINSAAPDVELTAVKTRDEFRQRLPQAEVVYGSLTAADLELARNLKWVQTPAAGVENLEPAVVAEPGRADQHGAACSRRPSRKPAWACCCA